MDPIRERMLAQTEIRRFTGKQFVALEKELENLSAQALADLRRLIREAETQVTVAKRQAMTMPWRR